MTDEPMMTPLEAAAAFEKRMPHTSRQPDARTLIVHARATAGGEATGPGDDVLRVAEALDDVDKTSWRHLLAERLRAHRCAGPAVEVAGEAGGDEGDGPVTRHSAPGVFEVSTADGDVVATSEMPDPDDDHVEWARRMLDDAGMPAGWYGLSTNHGPTNPDHIAYTPAASLAEGDAGSTLRDLVDSRAAHEAVFSAFQEHDVRNDDQPIGWWAARAILDLPIRRDAASPSPEVVTGEEAVRLPVASWVIQADEDGAPRHWARPFYIREGEDGKGGYLKDGEPWPYGDTRPFRVLYRAPVPPAPLSVGDTVETAEQLDALPVGAVIASTNEEFGVGKRAAFGWLWIEPPVQDAVALPARVLDLPGGES